MTDDGAERRFSSVDDFIAWEERQSERFEFLDGQVWSLCQHYVLVSQETQMVEVYSRAAAGWTYQAYRDPGDMIELANADARLAMTEIYRDTDA
jgi:hypothetical protein